MGGVVARSGTLQTLARKFADKPGEVKTDADVDVQLRLAMDVAVAVTKSVKKTVVEEWFEAGQYASSVLWVQNLHVYAEKLKTLTTQVANLQDTRTEYDRLQPAAKKVADALSSQGMSTEEGIIARLTETTALLNGLSAAVATKGWDKVVASLNLKNDVRKLSLTIESLAPLLSPWTEDRNDWKLLGDGPQAIRKTQKDLETSREDLKDERRKLRDTKTRLETADAGKTAAEEELEESERKLKTLRLKVADNKTQLDAVEKLIGVYPSPSAVDPRDVVGEVTSATKLLEALVAIPGIRDWDKVAARVGRGKDILKAPAVITSLVGRLRPWLEPDKWKLLLEGPSLPLGLREQIAIKEAYLSEKEEELEKGSGGPRHRGTTCRTTGVCAGNSNQGEERCTSQDQGDGAEIRSQTRDTADGVGRY